jgi:hypothetical protein
LGRDAARLCVKLPIDAAPGGGMHAPGRFVEPRKGILRMNSPLKATCIVGCAWLLIFIHSPLHPSEYFVDNGHPSASDANPGTESLPWLTIQKGANTADPGDTIFVKTGTYDERVMVTRDGTPAAKITFKALPRRSVQVLHGFNLTADARRLGLAGRRGVAERKRH